MTFTSNIFIIGLLPWFLCIYRMMDKRTSIKMLLLLGANTLFYVWGGVGALLFLCCFSFMVWCFSSLLFKYNNKGLLVAIIICTVTPLLTIKYTHFIVSNLVLFSNIGTTMSPLLIPVGLSFFTFEAVSLLLDIYRRKITEKPSLLNVYMYLSFFLTVTSGPIIRYDEFRTGFGATICKNNNCNDSIERIIIGLAKKVLIANKLAFLADYYFDGTAKGNEFSCLGLWIGAIAYSLQLYFDFSGYSDIAIGIGKLLGFELRENFNSPYQASSISDFWKRWHISLTQWFRDYIYIPLGGNRCSAPRHIFNMLIVWLLTGIWHGADWSFLAWGLGYFVLLLAEKYIIFMKKIENTAIGHIYALFFINLLWIPFRSNNIRSAIQYIKGMFGAGTGIIEQKAVDFLPFLILTAILCLPWKSLIEKISEKKGFVIFKGFVLLALLWLLICALTNSSYTPYIYGNF